MGDNIGVSACRIITIANGESLSGALDVLGWEVVSIEQAANTEGTTFSAQGSLDGIVFADIQTDAAEWSAVKSATAAQVIYLPQDKRLRGFSQIKIRTGLSGAATNQTGAATLKVGLVQVTG